jgi:hypothetical protein
MCQLPEVLAVVKKYCPYLEKALRFVLRKKIKCVSNRK